MRVRSSAVCCRLLGFSFVILGILGAFFSPQAWGFDPYDGNDPQVHEELMVADGSIDAIVAAFFEGRTLQDIELAELQRSLHTWTQYKFDEVSQGLKLTMNSTIKALPDLFQKSGNNHDFLKSAALLLDVHYTELRRIANKEDAAFLNDHLAELSDFYAYLKKKNLMSVESETALSQAINSLIDTANIANKNLFKRNATVVDQNYISNLADGKNFSTTQINPNNMLADDVSKDLGIKYIDIFRERMRQKAQGQPEFENALARWELKRILGFKAKLPEKIWAMGLPGVGKDSYTYAFIEALHPNNPKARFDHVLRIDACRTDADTSRIFGSGPDYINAWSLSAFVKFAVKHSGGKYHIETSQDQGRVYERVVEGPGKEPGFQPYEGVVFINEFHDWSEKATNIVLKEFLETGRIRISSPNGGVSELYVPLRTIVASNDGIELLRPREKSSGKAVSYQEMLERWQAAVDDPQSIRDAIKSRSDQVVGKAYDQTAGITDEALDRWGKDELILLRPLAPEHILKITEIKSQGKLSELEGASKYLNAKFTISAEAVEFMATYKQQPDQGARLVDAHVRELFENIIYNAIESEELKPCPKACEMRVLFEKDSKGNIFLIFTPNDGSDAIKVAVTQTKILPDLFSPEEVKRFDDFRENFKKSVFGADQLADQITEALFLSEAHRRMEKSNIARRFAFLGISGSGKSLSAKMIAKFFFGSEDHMEFISFNNVRSKQDVIELIYGLPGQGPSAFMKAYRKRSGKMVLFLDEIANIRDPDILTPLYDLLDEAKAKGFIDGKERPMDNVIIVMAGNATEEIYKVIDKNLPDNIQRQAQIDIFQRFNANMHMKRQYLENYFRQALYNRLGNGIVIFSPLDHGPLRSVVHAKVADMISKAESVLRDRNIKLKFKSKENYIAFANAVEEATMDIWKQGRSVENTMNDTLLPKILLQLQSLPLKNESEVVLEFKELRTVLEFDAERQDLVLEIHSDGQNKEIVLQGKSLPEDGKSTELHKLQVAIHEAGHDIARRALFASQTEPVKVSIIPGLAEIGGQYVHYAGVAMWKILQDNFGTRNELVARLATLYAGAEAQRLINRGGVADYGQRNDIERASQLSSLIVLKFGLDNGWGLSTPNDHENMSEYLARMSDSQKQKFEEAAFAIQKEGKALAREVLQTNFDQLLEMGRQLAQKGEMHKAELLQFYKDHPIVDYWTTSNILRKIKIWTQSSNWSSFLARITGSTRTLEPQMASVYVDKSFYPKVVSVDALLEQRKQEAVANIPLPEKIQFADADKDTTQGCKAALAALSTQ